MKNDIQAQLCAPRGICEACITGLENGADPSLQALIGDRMRMVGIFCDHNKTGAVRNENTATNEVGPWRMFTPCEPERLMKIMRDAVSNSQVIAKAMQRPH